MTPLLMTRGQNPLHQFPRNKSVTSWLLPRSNSATNPQHKRQVRNKLATLQYPGKLYRHGRSDGGVYRYIYPPKIRPGKFLWSKNDVLMVIDLIIHYYTSPKKISGYAPGYRETCVMDFGRNQPVLPEVTVAEPLFSICLRQRLKAS